MASYRYERDIDPKDLKPRKQRQYTRKERWANWWDYNLKWVIILGILVAFFGYNFIGQYFFTVKPDYRVAVVAPHYLPEATQTALQDALAAYGEDLNGDGKVVVKLNVYTMDFGNEDSDAYLDMAGTTKLSTDIQGALSSIFILYDPAGFQQTTGHPALSGRQPAAVRRGQRLVEYGLPLDRLPGAGGPGPGRLHVRRGAECQRLQPGVAQPLLHRHPGRMEQGFRRPAGRR